ncbi:MAG TPA: CDP-alcohol phosphatidyltransferase family protein [Flavisolibacter sp.]
MSAYSRHKPGFYLVNGITLYRLLASFVLLFLVATGREETFKWMLAISFFTDAIDGPLARRFHTVSPAGARLDSIADDLTIVSAIVGMIVFKPSFITEELTLVVILAGLYLVQVFMALARYHKLTSFHTILAKVAAVFQGVFLILLFFLPEPPYILFYAAAVVTILDLVEEMILIWMLPVWQTDVRGIFWILRKRNTAGNRSQRADSSHGTR